MSIDIRLNADQTAARPNPSLLVVTEWPLGASGKIDRKALIRRLSQTVSA
jgi:hypothetical protein